MNEQEMNQDTGISEESGTAFNEDGLDLGSAESEFDPFGDDGFADEEISGEEPVKPTPPPKANPAQKATTPLVSLKTTVPATNPLEKAMDDAETKDAAAAQKSLFTKPPVFEFGSAKEDVEDTSKTFEDLRIEKATDFPELEEGKKVSWTVVYGTITKTVTNPKGTTVGKMKSEIETSKEFLDALKKAKDKNPSCLLKPKITAQTKGKMPLIPEYKGVFTSQKEAEESGKVITLFPAKDGQVYEMRNEAMGKFITPSKGNSILSEVTAGFIPALPLLDSGRLFDIINFFRSMALRGNYEALVNVYWDKEEKDFILDVPKQTVTPVSVNSETNPAYDGERYIHYMDIHSHNRMSAFFSQTDDLDEKATRVYAVVGRVFDYFPQIRVRISNGGTFMEIDPGIVFDSFDCDETLAELWLSQVRLKKNRERKPEDTALKKMRFDFADGEDE